MKPFDQKLNLLHAIDQDDTLFLVDFAKADLNNFRVAGLNAAADVLGLDGHFTVAAFDQDAEGNALRPAEIKKAVHGGADGAAGIKDVIDQDEVHVIDAERNVRRAQNSLGRNLGKVVAIESYVEDAHGNIHAVDSAHGLGNPLRQRHAPPDDPDQRQVFRSAAFLHDFMGQSLQRAVDFRGRHQLALFNDAHGRLILSFLTAPRSIQSGIIEP